MKSKKDHVFIRLMKIMTLVYAVGGALFFFFHSLIERLIWLGPTPDYFWVALATSMMAMLSYASWQSAQTPEDPRWVRIHLLSKAVSVFGFSFACLLHAPLVGYLVGVFTDATVFGVVWASYRSFQRG